MKPGDGLPPPPTGPTATHMHSHEPGDGLPPPPTGPTATHMHSHETQWWAATTSHRAHSDTHA